MIFIVGNDLCEFGLLTFTLLVFFLKMGNLVVGVRSCFVLLSAHMFLVQTSKCLLGLVLSRGVEWTEREVITHTCLKNWDTNLGTGPTDSGLRERWLVLLSHRRSSPGGHQMRRF